MTTSSATFRKEGGLATKATTVSPPDGLFVTVLDDYYDDPDAVRAFAASCEFAVPFTGTWNGLQSLQRHPETEGVYFDLVARLPETGTPMWCHIEQSYQFWGQPSAGMFALLFEGQRDTVHFHRRSGRWAGVCYLAEPARVKGRAGVSFYRHKATGTTDCGGLAPTTLERLRQDGPDDDAWECLYTVAMRYNRMVLFDGRFFHAASPGFGASVRDGRLTQLFNIDFDAGTDSDASRSAGEG